MADGGAFELRQEERARDAHVFTTGKGRPVVCATEKKGRAKNRNVNLNEIVVGLGNAIPLWESDVTLYWRFDEQSFSAFANPAAAKARIRELLDAAIAKWGDAAPVRFEYREDGWDFDIDLRNSDDCDASGCVLASAFFPAMARDRLTIYPQMLAQDEDEQVETLIHELGHVFGLRHFFANVSETRLPSEIFGTHAKFSIMNYGAPSVLTDADLNDLRELYRLARSRELTAINGTPIRLMRPISAFGT